MWLGITNPESSTGRTSLYPRPDEGPEEAMSPTRKHVAKPSLCYENPIEVTKKGQRMEW